ncbi:MAG: hypothetical protein NWE89_07235 [Candidatus Bathyarchaeota archaeon]|nr:hypothetical protein [Candidatus Bathyarchaeota archaeon]
MEHRELVKLIPNDIRPQFSERLTDILLESSSGSIPPRIAKIILHYWQRDQLDSQAGLTHLIEAVAEAAPDKLAQVLEEFKLQKIAYAFSPIWDKQF